MSRLVSACAAVLCVLAATVYAQEANKLIGTWKLVSYEVEAQADGRKGPVMGDKPAGYATFTSDGRVFFVLTGEARKPAKTDQERAELLNTLVAYSSTYTLAGDQWRPASRSRGTRNGWERSRSERTASKETGSSC